MMKASLYFHRFVIICAAIVALFSGAVAQGRVDAMRNERINQLSIMTIYQLVEIQI